MRLFERIAEFLDQNPDLTLSYGEVAHFLGSHPRAVGRAMRALADRGRHDLCGRVSRSDAPKP